MIFTIIAAILGSNNFSKQDFTCRSISYTFVKEDPTIIGFKSGAYEYETKYVKAQDLLNDLKKQCNQ